jgi:regulatory ArsR family protein
MGGRGRAYGVVAATAGRRRVDEDLEWSYTRMAEPVPAPVLAAIAQPLHLALLVALEGRPSSPAELAVATRVAEPSVEQALAVLHDAGLVTTTGNVFRATGRGWADVAGALRALERASRPSGDAPA